MEQIYNDFPRVLHQVSEWDLQPENKIPHAHQYRELYPCDDCHCYLPYIGYNHGCTAGSEEDEGFFERDDYRLDFHVYCVETGMTDDRDLFHRQCPEPHIHLITPPPLTIPDDDDNDGMNVPQDVAQIVEEEDLPDIMHVDPVGAVEPDIMVLDDEVEVIVIYDSDDDVMEIN